MSAGTLSQVSLALESTWGTAVVPTKSIGVHPGDGIQTDIDAQFITAIKGQIAKNVASFKGKQKHEGEYEFDFIPGFAGYLLKSVFGSVSSALKGGETIVYDHTFSENEVKPSLTIEQAVGEIVRRYAGAIVSSLKLSCKTGEPLVANVSVQAKSSASATKITPVYETLRPFNFADISPTTGFKIGSLFMDEVDNFELEYNNNLQLKHLMGQNDPVFNFIKASEVKGKIDLYLTSDVAAKYVEYLNKTDNSIDIVIAGDAIGVSSNYKLSISIPKAAFKAAKYPVTDDYNMVAIEYEGVYDTATSKLISVVLTNLTSNYN